MNNNVVNLRDQRGGSRHGPWSPWPEHEGGLADLLRMMGANLSEMRHVESMGKPVTRASSNTLPPASLRAG